MTANGIAQILVFFAIVAAVAVPLGTYMARVFAGERTILSPLLLPVETILYRLSGVDEKREQSWVTYAVAMLLFNLFCFVSLYALLRLQSFLPFNPQGMPAVPGDLSLNTAISFTTNTNWQNYGGETTLSYLVQMAGLTVHNFVSAATGIAIVIALIRGFVRRSATTVGNFWVDLTRCNLYILLPVSIAFGLIFVWQGMPQNLHPYTIAHTLEGAKQVLAQGPVGSQISIKTVGTNGGGFFNVNAAHPYENPTALSNLLTTILEFLIGAGLTMTFGRMVGNMRQGWALFGAMAILFFVGVFVSYGAESAGNPAFTPLGIDQHASDLQAGGNMEGKEVRFGIADSSLFETATTDTSDGAVNSMHDSYTPIGGLVPIINMQLGEIIFGGVGCGLYGMLLFAILAVFIAGLMVGRTPEYLGKKIESREVKMAMLAVLSVPLSALGFTAIACVLPVGLAGLNNQGPHGFSEILYAFTSQTANNGSAFAGLTGNTLFYNTTGAVAMMIGRFAIAIPVLAIAGSLVGKKLVPASAGTFPTDNGLFVGLLLGVIIITGGLIYFPADILGPFIEHLQMQAGKLY
ncbi:MAG TPA: potassium-transporting ATPase subunit KdpA [Rhizomicrobium sp.]|jgi:K+-transporting ATPase ATPase A chain|nr:potassium-transporting ATPase subunit KdpA [Rhizomicrobium sp.]